jgi:hypothetical protein
LLQGWAILDVTPKHVTSTWYFTPNINRPGDYTLVRFRSPACLPSQLADRAPESIRTIMGSHCWRNMGLRSFVGTL